MASGTIKFSGLASGIQFDEMVAKLVEAEKYQANKLTKWRSEWQTKVDKLGDLDTYAQAIQTANDVLKKSSSFYSRLASSSDTSIADVTVDSSALEGSYNLEVASSTKHKVGSKGWADTNTTPIASGPGTFSFTDVQGHTISVAVDATTTMDGLKTLIDGQITAAGSTATTEIINDGSTSNKYRLAITSGVAGTAGKISITQDNTLLSFNANSMDTVENIKWSGTSAVTASGTYTGNVNKRLVFQASTGGTIASGDVVLNWTDTVENKSGSISVPASGIVNVTQGITLNFAAGTVVKNNKFALDLFNPDIQAGQDTGLAQASKMMHTGFSDSTSTPVTTTAGTFSYTFAGNAVTPITVEANTTLQGLANLINSDPDNPGIAATIINDGRGSATSYHLVLTGKSTGVANKISNVSFSGLTNFVGTSFSETQAATNSMVKLDNYPNGDSYIQNSGNLLTDVIDGASIVIKSDGNTSITVSNDIDDMADKVQTFVDAYNSCIDYINEITKVVSDNNGEASTDESGVLVGNYAVTMVKDALKSFIGRTAIGFNGSNDPYTLLPQIGLFTNATNQLELDVTKFKEEMAKNPDKVVELFSAAKIGVTDNSNLSYLSGTDLTQGGEYDVESSIVGGVLSGRYRKVGDDTWYTLKSGEGKYLTFMTGDAKGAALVMNTTADGTYNTTLRIKEGKSQEYYKKMDTLLDDDTGIIKVLEKNYEDIMKNIDKKIERELSRVETVKNRLEAKYAKLEVTIQNYNSMSERIKSQIGSLPTMA